MTSRRVARAFETAASVPRFGPRPRLQADASTAALAAGVPAAALGPPVSPGPIASDFHFQMPLRMRGSEHTLADVSVEAASRPTARRAVTASSRRRPAGHCRWCLLPAGAEDPAGSWARRRRQPEVARGGEVPTGPRHPAASGSHSESGWHHRLGTVTTPWTRSPGRAVPAGHVAQARSGSFPVTKRPPSDKPDSEELNFSIRLQHWQLCFAASG